MGATGVRTQPQSEGWGDSLSRSRNVQEEGDGPEFGPCRACCTRTGPSGISSGPPMKSPVLNMLLTRSTHNICVHIPWALGSCENCSSLSESED